MMKIISYNVNGIRAAFKKDFIGWLNAAQPDVLCLQETKAQKEQVDTEAIEKLGYHHYWFSAQKKGYSGVSIICKQKPNHIEYGTGIEQMDFEGRVIRADFENCSVVSMYLPSGTNTDRLEYKFKFMDEIRDYFAILQKKYRIWLFVEISTYVIKLLIFMTRFEIKMFQAFYLKSAHGWIVL